MFKSYNKVLTLSMACLFPISAFALPVDWQGTFGIDTNIISDYRRVKGNNNAANDGSQDPAAGTTGKDSLSWQSYIFRLSPSIIINDSATFKAELSTGYAFGGIAGDDAQTDKAGNNNVPLYYHNQTSGKELVIRQAYLELYSDTATYVIGRHTHHWGLGAIYNSGENLWDRHASSRDGVTMKLKLGNFNINPFYAKVNQSLLVSDTDTKEYGVGLLYDNAEKDIAFGLNHTIKKTAAGNNFYIYDPPSQTAFIGESDMTLTSLYFNKTWGDLNFALELPLITGDISNVGNGQGKSSYSTRAVLIETNYQHNDSWKFSFHGGRVNGHDGSSKFGALYLNPNYQVANLLFRYNMLAANDSNRSIYDSYITNAMYFKLGSTYTSEKWNFETAVIWAQAIETAKSGQAFYNHSNNKFVAAALADQDKNLGTEIDINATYKWNKEISVGLNLGYLITGDYFSFNNSTTPNETTNSFVIQLNTAVKF